MPSSFEKPIFVDIQTACVFADFITSCDTKNASEYLSMYLSEITGKNFDVVFLSAELVTEEMFAFEISVKRPDGTVSAPEKFEQRNRLYPPPRAYEFMQSVVNRVKTMN